MMRYIYFLSPYRTGLTFGVLLGLLAVFIPDHAHLCELWTSLDYSQEEGLCTVYDNPLSLIFLPLMAFPFIAGTLLSALPISDSLLAGVFTFSAPWLQLAVSVLIFVAIGVSIQYLVRKRHTPSIKQN